MKNYLLSEIVFAFCLNLFERTDTSVTIAAVKAENNLKQGYLTSVQIQNNKGYAKHTQNIQRILQK